MDESGVGVFFRVGGVQAVDVGEQHQQVGLGTAGHDGAQGVVVAYGDLFRCHRVVLVDDGQGVQLQQTVQSVLEVLPPLSV